jgi:hypothetical protein
VADLIPITDAQTELGKAAITSAADAGGWVASILQDVPKDLIGLLVGDWLHHTRQRNLAKLDCIRRGVAGTMPLLTPLGRGLLAACEMH